MRVERHRSLREDRPASAGLAAFVRRIIPAITLHLGALNPLLYVLQSGGGSPRADSIIIMVTVVQLQD